MSAMENTEPSLEQNLDISKFLNLENSSYAAVEKKYYNVTLLRMLKEGLHTDVTINANGGAVKAHKAVLVSVSPVFEAMFVEEQPTSVVDLPDISIEGLQLFLVLVYILNDNVAAPLEFEKSINKHFDELLEACCKYQVRRLRPTITANSKLHLIPENCWDYVHQSTFMDVNVTYKCGNCIPKYYKEVIESETFISEMQINPTYVQGFLIRLWRKDSR